MFKRKCPSCAKKIERGFNFCPYCGESFKRASEEKNYGIIGKDDSTEIIGNEMPLPFGMEKIMNSLINQIERQMNEIENSGENPLPRGFKIKISTGAPMKQVLENKKPKIINAFTEEQIKEKIKLPKVEAVSKVRRLSDRIIYEIDTPGVRSPKEVIITQLASGMEIKAFSKDKCYTKSIPLTLEVIQYYVKEDKLFLELKT